MIADDALDPPLTAREIEVLTLAARGCAGPEIARQLVVSPSTVKTHFSHIYEKLGVKNRAAAVARAMQLRVIKAAFPWPMRLRKCSYRPN